MVRSSSATCTYFRYHSRRPVLYRRSYLQVHNSTGTVRLHPRSYHSPRILQSTSSIGPLFAIIATTSLLGGAYLFLQPAKASNPTPFLPPVLDIPSSSMPTEILPGRASTLTPEQELKLQEFWIALLRICGVSLPDESHATGRDLLKEAATEQRARAGSHDSDKKKRSRLSSMFSGGSKKKDGTGGADDESGAGSNSEDKYGQEKEFQHILSSTSPKELRKALWSMTKHDDPDELLLRFLRARKWNVHNALVMLISTLHWRLEMRVDDDLMRNGEHGAIRDRDSVGDPKRQKRGKDFLFQLEKGKSFVHGTDKDGRPMCFIRVRLHKAADQEAGSLERYTVYVIETARLALVPPVDTAAIVFDMTDFSMANMDYTPVKFMIKIFEANYPESLGAILVHRAPWAFNAIWHVIKGWLDPVVAAKVHFTNSIDDLSQFVEVAHIPQEIGGKDPWRYEYVAPKEGENSAMEVDGVDGARERIEREREEILKGYERVTLRWVRDPASRELREERRQLRDRLRRTYWDLDPYVRARSWYDRTGMIQSGGRIEFYPGEIMDTVEAAPAPTQGEGVKKGVNGGLTSQPVVNGHASEAGGRVETRADDVD